MLHQLAAMMILFLVTGVKHIGAENILKEMKKGTEGDLQRGDAKTYERANNVSVKNPISGKIFAKFYAVLSRN